MCRYYLGGERRFQSKISFFLKFGRFSGGECRVAMTRSLGKWTICDVISPEMETSVTQDFAGKLQSPLLLPVPNLIVIGVS